MRSFLKQLRKGFKTACLTAALATCWQVGQTAEVMATPIEIQISGAVAPVTNDLSHLYFIYGTGYSSLFGPLDAVLLGDFTAGQTTPFSVTTTINDNETLWWYTASVYGDVSGGTYSEGTNGVTLGINASEGDPWSSYSYSYDEADFFDDILNDIPENLPEYSSIWNGWNGEQYSAGVEIADSSILYDFSTASSNGTITISTEIVPEPTTIVLLGTGGFFTLRRRKKD